MPKRIKKININQLQKNMYIDKTDRKWIDIPFFRQKFLVTSDKQIDTLRKYCNFVYINTKKGIDIVDNTNTEIEQQSIVEPIKTDIPDNNTYKKSYEQSQTVLSQVLNDVRLGRSVDNPKIRGIVEELIINIVKDNQAMIALTRLKDKHDALARKSVNVCILSLAFGKHIGIPKEKMYTLGVGALLHDIGMVQIPTSILLKQQALTLTERRIMEKHTEFGLAILSGTPEIQIDVLKIVHSHHERMDGTGYPQKLHDKEISLLTRMVSITSVYEALTRERFYSDTLSPLAALKYLYVSGKTIFDARLVEKFIQMLGIYPAGCVVELNTGELGIVVNVNQQDRLRPTIQIITNSKKQLLSEQCLINLGEQSNCGIEIIKTLAMDDPIIELLMTLHEQMNNGISEQEKS